VKANVEINGTLLILSAALMIVAAMLARELIAALVRSVIERVAESVAGRPRPMLARVTVRGHRAIPTEALPVHQAWRAPPPFLGDPDLPVGETVLPVPIRRLRPVDPGRRGD
jgi:hypothetical protein